MELVELTHDIVEILAQIDQSKVPFRGLQPGVGPYGEPQLVKLLAQHLGGFSKYAGACTKRARDLLIPQQWALEFKIARPYGDNEREAENWSVNLLHPYAGNVSAIGDCLKLAAMKCPERKAVVVIGYEHEPTLTDLTPLVDGFEVLAKHVARIQLSPRVQERARD